MANSTKISALYGRVFQAERDASEVERQLGRVENEQADLEAVLERAETEVDALMEAANLSGDGGLGGVDGERERTYKAAENCDARLTQMGQSLTEMIEEINAAATSVAPAATGGQQGDDPLAEIVRVLNGHLAQLQAIDQGAAELRGRVGVAQREARSLGAGEGRGAPGANRFVEDFGRSYLGGR